jgi:hypothetical protein
MQIHSIRFAQGLVAGVILSAACSAADDDALHIPDLDRAIQEREREMLQNLSPPRQALVPQRMFSRPKPWLRRDLTRHVRLLDLDLSAHAQALIRYLDFQAAYIELQGAHIPAIAALATELARYSSLTPRATAELTEEFHLRLLQPFYRQVESLEVQFLAELIEHAPDSEQFEERRQWIECDRLRQRYDPSPVPPDLPGAQIDFVSMLDEMGIDWSPDDGVGAIVREYVVQLGPLRKQRFERFQHVSVRDAHMYADAMETRDRDYVNKRRSLRRGLVGTERRLRELNIMFSRRFAEALEPEAAAQMTTRVRAAIYPGLYPDSLREEFTHKFSVWGEGDRWSDAERGLIRHLEAEYDRWYERRTGELERAITAWYEDVAGALAHPQTRIHDTIEEFRHEHRDYTVEVMQRVNDLAIAGQLRRE